MGCFASGVNEVPCLLSHFGVSFDFTEFKKARDAGTADELLSKILSISINMQKQNLAKMQIPTGKVCFMVCNTYPGVKEFSDPICPLNDCATVAHWLKRIGYTIYFIYNPTKDQYIQLTKYFIEADTEYCILYYNGVAEARACGVEADSGKEEVLIFKDGVAVSDDEMAKVLAECKKPESSKVILINESAHSECFWNLKNTAFSGYTLPKNILSINGRRYGTHENDHTSAKKENAGVFTFYVFRFLNDEQGITATELAAEINKRLARYEQYVIMTATSEELENEPVIPKYTGKTTQ